MVIMFAFYCYGLNSQAYAGWKSDDIVKSVGADPDVWRAEIRGFRMEKWRTLSAQEGSNGGTFVLVSLLVYCYLCYLIYEFIVMFIYC